MSKKRRMSPKEKQAKIEAAKKSEAAAKRSQERAERTKKLVTVIVCVILILGLGIPTMSLTVCSQQNKAATTQADSSQDSGSSSTSQ